MGYIKSNLPNDAQPWGRDIQARLEALEAKVAANEINNASRDTRMQSAINTASQAVAYQQSLNISRTEIVGPSRSTVLSNYIGGGENVTGSVDVSDLNQSIHLTEGRTVQITYSSKCDILQASFSSTDTGPKWTVETRILVDGQIVSTAPIGEQQNYTSSNPLTSNLSSTNLFHSKSIFLPAGIYNISMYVYVYSGRITGTTTFFLQGDSLTIEIIK